MSIVARLCERLTKRMTPRRIDRDDGDYLLRYFLFGGPRDAHPGDANQLQPGPAWARRLPFAPYLHHFLRSDAKTHLHNHPWKWGFSIILSGGYRELRWEDGENGPVYSAKNCRAGAVNVIHHDTFHRVDLLPGGETWTLFIAGPRVADWGFRDFAGRYTPHAVFNARGKNGAEVRS
jgi:hypothetical protein